MEVTTEETKMCQKCKIVKPKSDFCKVKSRYDGLNCYCKPCCSQMKKEAGKKKQVVKEQNLEVEREKFLESIKKDGEEWKEFAPSYYISNKGRVYSKMQKHNSDGQLRLTATNLNYKGYLYIKYQENGKNKGKFIHRLLAENFIPNPDNLPVVDHIDRNRTNNSLDNLRWATCKENSENTSVIPKGCISIRKRYKKDGSYTEYFCVYFKNKNLPKRLEKEFRTKEEADRCLEDWRLKYA